MQLSILSKKHPNSSIVTTNYDGCIDEALLRASVSFNTHIAQTQSGDDRELDLIKIHGSINWSYCDSCHDVREFDLINMKRGYENDTITYAVVGICKNCGGQRRPLLIPPMGIKFVMFPNLIRLWNLARENRESCDFLIVVGFSFSEADSYINKIIERSMSFKDDQVMIVCDPNMKVVRSLRQRYSARIEGFNSGRVLAALGSDHKVVPGVLESLASESEGKGRRSKAKDAQLTGMAAS
jgi:NAD-dependent SIR2 family protein deacetylase